VLIQKEGVAEGLLLFCFFIQKTKIKPQQSSIGNPFFDGTFSSLGLIDD
jgi:hypothetical protein